MGGRASVFAVAAMTIGLSVGAASCTPERRTYPPSLVSVHVETADAGPAAIMRVDSTTNVTSWLPVGATIGIGVDDDAVYVASNPLCQRCQRGMPRLLLNK